MKFTCGITREDRREARRIYHSFLSQRKILLALLDFVSFAFLGFSFWFFHTHRWAPAICFLVFFGYLFSIGPLFRRVAAWIADIRRAETQNFQVTADASGIVFSRVNPEPSTVANWQKNWPEFRAYCQTPRQFVLATRRDFCVIPKRSLTSEQTSEFIALLNSNVPQLKPRVGIRVVVRVASLTLLAFLIFFLFGGTIQWLLWLPLTAFQTRATTRSPHLVRLPRPASPSQLHGRGEIYLVPIGDTSSLISPGLLQYYQNKYGLSLHVLASIPVPPWARDEARHQLVVEELIEAMRRAYPALASDGRNILIGLTNEDMYISILDWKFALNYRETPHELVISTARLTDGMRAAPEKAEARLRKLLTKNIGICFYGLELSGDPGSVLYWDVENVETLDAMGEDYSVRDGGSARKDRGFASGDTCFTVRHYYSREKQRTDSASLSGCSTTHGETDLQVLNIYLRYGLLLSRKTDFYLPGPLPLELSRLLRTQDRRSRAFGIGASHNLNIFPVGNIWPFTWMDLILEDGGRLHYSRRNWGAAFWDAVYVVEPTTSDFYSSYITWNWLEWKLLRQDGIAFFFPSSGPGRSAEQSALIRVRDRSGNSLQFDRDPSGALMSATSNLGSWIHFDYDSVHRITAARANDGREFSYHYAEDGCLDEVRDAEHHVTTYGHDGVRCPSSMAIDGRQVWTARFDSADRVTQLDLAGAGTYEFTYVPDESGAVVQVQIKDPGKNVFRLTYEGSGYRFEQEVNGNSPPLLH